MSHNEPKMSQEMSQELSPNRTWARPAQPFSFPDAPQGSFSSPHGGGNGCCHHKAILSSIDHKHRSQVMLHNVKQRPIDHKRCRTSNGCAALLVIYACAAWLVNDRERLVVTVTPLVLQPGLLPQ